MKDSKLLIRAECYSSWFVVNFLICLLPIILTAIIKAKVENIIAGYLGFIFTRLVGSLFIYYSKRNTEIFEQLLFTVSLFCTLACFACLPLYTTNVYVTDLFDAHPGKIILYSLLVTILLCILLNRNVIENKVSEKNSRTVFSSNPGKTAKELQSIKTEIEKNEHE
jgi:hypothetical protein